MPYPSRCLLLAAFAAASLVAAGPAFADESSAPLGPRRTPEPAPELPQTQTPNARRESDHDLLITGIVLTSVGGAAALAGATMIATFVPATAGPCAGNCSSPSPGGQLLAGLVLIPVGAALVIAGVPVTAVGVYRSRAAAQVSLLPMGAGGALRVSF